MKISIITVNYNDAKGLQRTIKSVESLLGTFEFIIIDGDSKDDSLNVIKHARQNIQLNYISEPDTGIYNAMNKGVRMATGDYCIFMNAGDTFYDKNVINEIEKETGWQSDIITGVTQNVKNDIDITIWYPPKLEDLTLYYFLSSSISHQATFIRRELLLKYPYNEENKIVSDWQFWLEAIILNSCSYFASNVMVCRYDKSGMSNTNYGRLMTEREKVKKKIIPQRILQDYNLMNYDERLKNDFVNIAINISTVSGGIAKIMTIFCKIIYNLYCKLRNIKK